MASENEHLAAVVDTNFSPRHTDQLHDHLQPASQFEIHVHGFSDARCAGFLLVSLPVRIPVDKVYFARYMCDCPQKQLLAMMSEQGTTATLFLLNLNRTTGDSC